MMWLELFWEFFKTGLFSVGGGLATLPFLYDISERTDWFTSSDIADMVAISESTPGPLGINMSTYAGFQTEGILGGIFATLALTLPSLICITIIFAVLNRFRESRAVRRIFYGLRPASTALIAAAGLGVARIALLNTPDVPAQLSWIGMIDWKSCILAAAVYFALVKWRKHPVFYIALSAIAGIVFQM